MRVVIPTAARDRMGRGSTRPACSRRPASPTAPTAYRLRGRLRPAGGRRPSCSTTRTGSGRPSASSTSTCSARAATAGCGRCSAPIRRQHEAWPGRGLRGLGAQRPGGAGGRRLELLGRPGPPDAVARRVRGCGSCSSPACGRRPLQVRADRRRGPADPEGRPDGVRHRGAAGHGERRSPRRPATSGPTSVDDRAGRRRRPGPAHVASTRCHLGSWRWISRTTTAAGGP